MKILPSAYRHGLSDNNIEHAVRMSFAAFPNLRFRAEDDETGTMLLGPSTDGKMLEIAVHGYYDGEELSVFHANYATARIIDRLKGESR